MDKDFNCKEAYLYATLATISTKTDIMDFTNNSLIAITAAGTITGTYVTDQMKASLENDLSYLTFENIHTIAKESYGNTPSPILLKDATLITSQGFENRFNYLFVFIEDILALSYGNFTKN